MRLQDDFIDVENRFTKTFMRWRVTITVWHNTPTASYPDEFIWTIRFQSRDGVNFNWAIPWPDLYSMLPDLARNMNQDVAIVIYEALGERFNETLRDYQMGASPIREGVYFPNVTQIQFPPKEYFREELRLIEIEKWSRLHPHIYGESIADRISREDMERSFEQMRDYILTDRYAPTITAWATPQNNAIADCVNYLTSEEYERKKANGELNPNTVYLVFNNN